MTFNDPLIDADAAGLACFYTARTDTPLDVRDV